MYEMLLLSRVKQNALLPIVNGVGVYNLNFIQSDVPEEAYILGGVNSALQGVVNLWHWNAKTNIYTDLGVVPITQPRGRVSTAIIAGNIYCIQNDEIKIYNITGKTWSSRTGPVYPSQYNSNSLPAVAYKDEMYIFGPGPSDDTPGTWLKKYNIANNTWSIEATYTTTTNRTGILGKGVVIKDYAYFFGCGGNADKVIRYHFPTKAFMTLSTNTFIGSNPALAVLGKYIFVAPSAPTGATATAIDGNRVLQYDTVNNTYTKLGNVLPAKLPHGMLRLNNKLYLYGGTEDRLTTRISPNVQVMEIPGIDYQINEPIISTTPQTLIGGTVGTAVTASTGDIYVIPGQSSGQGTAIKPTALLRFSGLPQNSYVPAWDQPVDQTQTTAVDTGSRILYFGGAPNGIDIRYYDYTASPPVWGIEAQLTGVVGSLMRPSAARCGDWIVIAFGRETGSAKGTTLKYHIPTKTCTRLANRLIDGYPVDYGTVMTDGQYIYMHTATTYASGQTPAVRQQNIFQRFDPVTETFITLASPPKSFYYMPVGYHTDGYFVAMGVVDSGISMATRMIYSVALDVWSEYSVPEIETSINKPYATKDDILYVFGNGANQQSYSVKL